MSKKAHKIKEDYYQERYKRHQEKKKRQLTLSEGKTDNSKDRRSQRVFNSIPIEQNILDKILKVAETAPSSCNRHGLKMKIVSEREEKELLSGLLVGGVGWIHRADKIILFLADKVAYKSPNERDFMHYCDVGFLAMSLWLEAEKHGVGACYINPNITHKDIFTVKFGGDYIFCGALVLGNYDKDKRSLQSERGNLNEMLI